MNILITGGCGFLGARLARTLLAQGQLSLQGAGPRDITRITLADKAPPPDDLRVAPKIAFVEGDLNALLEAGVLPAPDTDLVFHLAAAVSGECEADFDLGMRSNFAATHALLEGCRRLGTRPAVVFSSSLAVFGASDERPLPPVIEDDTLPTPQTSYGIQKFIGEQLVADYTRKGFIRGRSVRPMTVSVRPGRPNGAASGFFSGIVREPLAGVRARCPVHPDTEAALASPASTIAGLMMAAQAPDSVWGPRIALNLPAITLTVGQMAQALERVAGPAATSLIDWDIDPKTAAIVRTWPGRVDAKRARAMGLKEDTSFEQTIRDYARENASAVQLPLLNS